MSAEEFGNIFREGLINGVMNGIGLFLRVGWPYIIVLLVIVILSKLLNRRKRKR